MDMVILPGTVLLMVVMLSGSHPSENSMQQISIEETKPAIVEQFPVPENRFNENRFDQDEGTFQSDYNNDLDYKAIHSYITTKYKKIDPNDATQISHYLVEYGQKNNLDPKFAAAVIARESAFNKYAVSRTGAMGLGQIKPFNFKQLKISNPHSIQQNVKGTVQYLNEMLSRWHNKSEQQKLALASYYKGYGAVKRSDGQLDHKTKKYVSDILNNYSLLSKLRNNFEEPPYPKPLNSN